MCSVVVVVDGVAQLLELVPAAEERLVSLLREGPRYGVHFVLLADTVRDVRFRMRASVGMTLAMAMADDGDFATALGSVRGVALPKGGGRGLVRQGDDLYAFQCAYACDEGVSEQSQAAAKVAEAVGRWGKPERHVPSIPAVLTPALLPKAAAEGALPVGIAGEDFSTVALGADEEHAALVCASQAFQCVPFMQACAVAAHERGWDVVVVDSGGLMGDVPPWASTEPEALSDGEGGPRLVVVPNALTDLEDSDELASLARGGASGGTLILAGASSSDLNRMQTLPWGQGLMFRSTVVWVGPGLANAYAMQVSTPASRLKDAMGEGGGFVVRGGKAKAVKLTTLPGGWGA